MSALCIGRGGGGFLSFSFFPFFFCWGCWRRGSRMYLVSVRWRRWETSNELDKAAAIIIDSILVGGGFDLIVSKSW